MRVLVGTAEGLRELGDREATAFDGREVTALAPDGAGGWALLEGRVLARRDGGDGGWREAGRLPAGGGTCLAAAPAGLLVGTAGAGLWRWSAAGAVRVDAFDRVPGREGWYTPWGDPPDTRSIAVDGTGAIYVNVHVGGVARSTDGGASWRPTLDPDTDVHQVAVDPGRPRRVLVASAAGFGSSEDGGETWRLTTEGLHAHYLRAVAVAEGTVLVSASTGPGGRRAALYRRPAAGGPFERCVEGLPRWFGDNVDTHCLAAHGRTVAVGTEAGVVYLSRDAGRAFAVLAKGLPPVRAVVLGP